MKLPKYFGKPKKLKLLYVRRVLGASMLPFVRPGEVVVALGRYGRLKPYDVVIIRHEGIEKIKRITKVRPGFLYVQGDNGPHSTDSRVFGWVDQASVVAKVIWPAGRNQD